MAEGDTLSIIIPVYNAEKTLRRSIDSVVNSAAFSDGKVDLVLVNDGSTDKSSDICKEYSAIRNQVQLIESQNEGVSAARNRGLTSARGQYVTFLDSDDFVGKRYHLRMLQEIDSPSIGLALSGFTTVGDGYQFVTQVRRSETITRREVAQRFRDLAAADLLHVTWNKMYRLDVIREHGIKFDAHRPHAEDFLFNLEYFAYVDLVRLLDQVGMYYFRHSESTCARLERAYDRIYELDYSLAYRTQVCELLKRIGVPSQDIAGHFDDLADAWFLTVVTNLQNDGSPYNKREQIRRVRGIMDFAPVRDLMLRSPLGDDMSKSRNTRLLAKLNRIIYRFDSAAAAWLILKVLAIWRHNRTSIRTHARRTRSRVLLRAGRAQ